MLVLPKGGIATIGGRPPGGGVTRWPICAVIGLLSYPSARRSKVPISNRLEQPSSICLEQERIQLAKLSMYLCPVWDLFGGKKGRGEK